VYIFDKGAFATTIFAMLINFFNFLSSFFENVKQLVTVYESPDHTPIDFSSICNELDSIPGDHNPVDFLMTFIQQYSSLSPLIQHCVRTETVCLECTHAKTVDEKEMIFNVMAHKILR